MAAGGIIMMPVACQPECHGATVARVTDQAGLAVTGGAQSYRGPSRGGRGAGRRRPGGPRPSDGATLLA
jgi:hypothetical protein